MSNVYIRGHGRVLRKPDRRRPNSSAGRRFNAVLEVASKVSETLLKVLALASPIAYVVGNLLMGRYLAAFGQPGPLSFGQSLDYIPLILLSMTTVTVVFLLFVGAPVFMATLLDTRDEGGFGAPFRVQPSDPRRFLIAHAGALVGFGWLIFVATVPGINPSGFGWSLAIGGVASLVWSWSRTRNEKGGIRRWASFALDVGLVFSANLILLLWVGVLASPVRKAVQAGLEHGVSANTAFAWALALLVLAYGLMTLRHWKAAALVVLVVGTPMLASVGDRALVGIALRAANLGGGAPMIYRPAGLNKEDRSRLACLVFAAGDTRIIWLPKGTDAAAEQSTEGCALEAFKERLKQGGEASDGGRLHGDDDIRVLKREDVFGSP
ncbi:hypothetical protein ACIQTU_10035 [Brevundimonas sp. NPDC090276]|uniref:hypothetical protein n=1 Tax=Brevundimonas sp. NPDC090276 TaxID=3363956 RepID=UPI00383AD965